MTSLSEYQQENRIVFETSEPGYEHGVEQTALSGPGLQLLNPSPRDQYQHRLHDIDGSVSELFQANARWRLCDLAAAPTDEEQRQLRTWFLASGRTYTTVESDRSGVQIPLADLPDPLGRGLTMLVKIGGDSDIQYASDVVVVWNGHTWLLPASGDRLVRMRAISDHSMGSLRAAVGAAKQAAFSDAMAIVSVTTVPWRVEIMQGPRGYRVAIQQSGLLLAATMQSLTNAGTAPVVATEFADTVVDQALDQDGVERFSTALIAVVPARPTSEATDQPDTRDHADEREPT